MEKIRKKLRYDMSSKNLRQEFNMDEHQISVDELCRRFDTDLRFGLTQAKADENLARDGKNIVGTSVEPPQLFLLANVLFQGFVMLLWLGAAVCVAIFFYRIYQHDDDINYQEMAMSIALLFVVVVMIIFTYFQGRKKTKTGEDYRLLGSRQTEVIRDGKRMVIPSQEVVVGDVVLIRFGDRIPADLRIVESQGFKVDNFQLTGEAGPQTKTEKRRETNPMESPNMAFLSSVAVEGTAKAVVLRTGNRTLIGQVLELGAESKKIVCPVTAEIERFLNWSAALAIFLSAVFVLIFRSPNDLWHDSIFLMFAITLAAVPEGILISSQLALKLMIKRLAEKNCLVKNVEAMEALGFVSTICIDKAGAITKNKLTVTHLWYDMKTLEVHRGRKLEWKDKNSLSFKTLSRSALLCNRAEFTGSQEDIPVMKKEASGNPTEVAILKFFTNCLAKKVERIKENYAKVCEIPHNVMDKFQLTIHETGGVHLLVMIGAPEYLVERCSTILMEGLDISLTYDIRDAIDRQCIELAQWGETITCVCDLTLSKDLYPHGYNFDSHNRNFPLTNLRLVGLISLFDAPKPLVPHAVSKCRSAGIKVIMITDDHPIAAKSVAKQIGIMTDMSQTMEDIAMETRRSVNEVNPTEASAVVVDGLQLKKMPLHDVKQIIENFKEVVFARTSPFEKLMIVACCRKTGSVVAVTGIGANDSPAMKQADISVAFGKAGCEETRNLADVILLDDSFSSLVVAVEESRLIIDNLKKSIVYSVTSNAPQIFAFFLHCILGIPLPLSVFAITCIDLGTDLWPAISLSYEREEYDVMTMPPTKSTDVSLFSFPMFLLAGGELGVIEAYGCLFTYFVVMADNGWTPGQLISVSESWHSPVINDLEDSFGQQWTYEARKKLEYISSSVFFLSIVIMQWMTLITCKTRRASVFKHGFKNWVLNFGIFFETVVALLICQIPGRGLIISARYLKPLWFVMPLPYMMIMLFYDEIRKVLIRDSYDWIYDLTYY